jgi:hypothetical protein
MTVFAYAKPRPDILCLYAARALRGFGDGFAIIILPVYLLAIGLTPQQVGIVASASLLGTAALTLLIGFVAPRYDLRNLFLIGAGLAIVTGLVFPMVGTFVPVLLVAFIGTINPSAGDLGMLIPLEHALLTQETSDRDRTGVFARYSLIGSLTAAAGSLAAALPEFMIAKGLTEVSAIRLMFYGYAVLGLLSALLYSRLPRDHMRAEARPKSALGPSRGIVYKLAALFSLDAFAGGFVVQSLLALAFSAVRFVARCSERLLLLLEPAERHFVSGCGVARQAHRAGQHDGVHPHSVEHLPDRGRVLFKPDGGAHSPAGPVGAVANGRADPIILRHGRCYTRRANRGGERDRGATQSGLLHQPCDRGLHAGRAVFSLAAGGVRMPEDRLRRRAARDVPAHETA